MQVFCYFSLMAISPHGVPPVSVRIQTETSTTKGTRQRRQLAIIYWQLMWYQLLIFGVILECDPSGSWKTAFDTCYIYGRHLALCHSRESSLTLLTLGHLVKCCCYNASARQKRKRNVSFCKFIHFNTEALQTASEGQNLQKPDGEDLGSPLFLKYISIKCIQNGSVFCFSRTEHAQTHIFSLIFALMFFYLRKLFKIDVGLPYGMLNDACNFM